MKFNVGVAIDIVICKIKSLSYFVFSNIVVWLLLGEISFQKVVFKMRLKSSSFTQAVLFSRRYLCRNLAVASFLSDLTQNYPHFEQTSAPVTPLSLVF